MKTKNLFRTALFALFAVMMLGFISCNNDDDMPVTPVDPGSEKGHDEWTKVTFTFRQGHTHADGEFHGDEIIEGVKYLKAVQEVTFQYDEAGNLVTTGTPIRFIEGRHYALEIKYYDKDGDLVNAEYGTPENSPLHQHFFLTQNAKVLNSETPFENPNEILDYTYRDTNPVDKNIEEDGVQLRENDPIGLKGYFFVKQAYAEFDLNTILVHIVRGNKFKSDGSTYPFNEPSQLFLGVRDFNQIIPIRVYTEYPANDEGIDKFIQDIASEFNITEEEAREDFNKTINFDDDDHDDDHDHDHGGDYHM